MFESLSKLKGPGRYPASIVGREDTPSNLRFAKAAEPVRVLTALRKGKNSF
jgi:hypothetical protein